LTKKTLYIIIFVHSIFFIFLVMFLKLQKDRNIAKYLHEFYAQNKVTFNKELAVLNKNTDLLKNLLIDKRVLDIVYQADMNMKNFMTARNQLIKVFLPKYYILKKNGFYLVHFHLRGGISFVRFHNLDKFGDHLLAFRDSIRYVQNTKKPFHGFEIGRGIGGFRNVYPLIYHNKLIGSFEISFSINNLINYMFAKEHLAMVVPKTLVNSRVFHDELKSFKTCKLNPEYYIWGNGCKLFSHIHHVNFNKKIHIIENNLIFAYPLVNVHNRKEGYILSIFPLKGLKVIVELNKNFHHMLVGVLMLYLVILMIIFTVYFYKQAKFKAQIDYLTQLLNRSGCMKKLHDLDNYALLIIDIDYFKQINDTYGHDKGDYVLKELSTLLTTHLRENDIICRWGGEEFLVILPHISLEHAIIVANKLRNLIKEHDFAGIKLTVSIGIAMFDGNFEATFKFADENLYKAKNDGRDRVVHKKEEV